MNPAAVERGRRRRRGRKRDPRSRPKGAYCYDWFVIGGLLLSSTVGVVVFGAVRNWSAGSLMVPAFLALLLFSIRPLWQPEARDWRVPPGFIPLLLFAAYAALSIPFSAVPYESKVEWLKIASYVGALVVWTTYAARDHRWKALLFIPVLLGSLVALYALVLHMRGSTAVLMLTRHEGYGYRASGTFMAPAHMGAYMGTIICLALCLVRMRDAGAWLRLFGGYGLLVCVPALLLSGSRSGWIGTALGVSALLCLLAARKGIRDFLLMLAAVISTGLVSVAALWLAWPEFQERMGSAVRIEGSAAWRLDAWQDTWRMFLDRMWFGFGPGTYRWTYPPFQTWGGYRWLRYAHNEYLHLLAEYGIVGTALLAVAVVVVLGQALRLFWRTREEREATMLAGFIAVLLAALGHGVFDFNWHVYALVHLVVMVGGVTFALCHRAGLLRERTLSLSSRLVLAVAVGGLAAWSAFAAFQVGTTGALVRLAEDDLEAIDLLHEDPYHAARRKYEMAQRIDRGNWLAARGLGDIARSQATWLRDPERRRQRVEAALAYYQSAYARNPNDMNVVFGIGRSWHLLGDDEQALKYMRRTVEHWPSNIFYSHQLALQLRRMGYLDEALEVVEVAWRHEGWRDPGMHQLRRTLREELRAR